MAFLCLALGGILWFLSFKRQFTYTFCISSCAVLLTPNTRILAFLKPFPDTPEVPRVQTIGFPVTGEFQIISE